MRRWSVVVAAGLVVFAAQLDTTTVLMALPALSQGLGVSPVTAGWAVLGYVVPLIGLSLLSGRWVDRVGHRSALLTGTTGFVVAAVAAAAAPSIGPLVAARVVQGAAAAVLLALAPALAVQAAGSAARSRALAVVSALGPMGAMSGPVLGGLVLETVGAPWIFLLSSPAAVLAAVIGLVVLPPGEGLGWPRVRWLGEAATFGTAAAAVLIGLSLAVSQHGGWLALAVVAVPLIGLWWRSSTAAPVRRMISDPVLGRLHLALATSYTAVLMVQFLIPFHLQRVLGVSPALAGAVLLAFPAATSVVAPLAGALTDRYGSRLPALTGAVLTVGGVLALLPLREPWSPAEIAVRLALVGAGFGLFVIPVQAAALSLAPPDLLATTAASTNLARHVGVALGPATATAAWALGGYTSDGMRAGLAVAAALGAVTALLVRWRARTPAGWTSGRTN